MEALENFIGTAFSTEQKEYLQGFFAGAMQRAPKPFVGETAHGVFTAEPGAAPNLAESQEDSFHGTPVSELCREEIWKYEKNPLDAWDALLQHADENRIPDAEHIYRFKFHGLFYVAPAQDSFMLRLRIPAGILKSYQLRGLAEIAESMGSGRTDITTRANLQIREFQPKDIVRVLTGLNKIGLTSRGSGADNIRNVTASPTAGLDPHELLDVGPYAEALHHYILNSRDMYGLPRKFNVAFDGGGAISTVADTNDIGFVAVRVKEGRSVPAGIYFRVLLCGITGHRQLAADCGILLPPSQAIALSAAMIRVFAENGDRTDRKKARLKYLVDKWGVEKFLEETQKILAFPLLRFPMEECEERRAIDRAGHIGVHPQSQSQLNYIGVSIPVGRFPVVQMRAVADIADRFGTGEIRLTVWQNLLIPNIHADNVTAVCEALEKAGLSCTAGTVLRGTVACTGNKGCRYASTDTKSHAVELANRLDSRFQIVQPVNLHVTGCPHSCAQHYVGDIGLMGVKVNGREGYQVVIGGGSDKDVGLARELISAVAYEDLPPVLENLIEAYLERCDEQESFLAFTRRHDIEQLRQLAEKKEQVQ